MEVQQIEKRPRRNRKSPAIRALVQETRLHPSNFVAPFFVIEGKNRLESIESMPGVCRFSVDLLLKEVMHLHHLGIRAIDLFPIIPKERKDRKGSEALRKGNLLEQAVRAVKQEIPDICLMVDIALDPYTDHGHDGIMDELGNVVNDETLPLLGEMAVAAAAAGVDFVAPSDMMDGRIAYIRNRLDREGYTQVGILAYAAKYASSFYGPFRDALQSAPKWGNKATYQMNPANGREALLELALDENEGADMLLIKPALPYLDVLSQARKCTQLPLGAYHVSGEYAMIMAAAQRGWIDGDAVLMESILAIKRAGADFIFTYGARRMGELLKEGSLL
jgi:porphobilinogen synthase